ncbi:hypothetical protein [Caulobacter vibrioides]|uniref:hypothetical protein n=1 Tax=Caulobacter vibrioides TaxID=155892 RepID=UPI000BB48F86|nr:hypothetical protein [Caulobacter vibrioides]ATC26474.1 hypothetical protein CA608_19040 [Caulobacter vibrioides]PLR12296.1 hypothetical protein CVUC_08670 [Caulobacter vibrioides]
MTSKHGLMSLALPEALGQVWRWLEDCEDLLALNPHRDLPRPPFKFSEAWVVVRLAAEGRGTPSAWKPIADWPERDEPILVATADGRRMFWAPSALKVAMTPGAPTHLQFPATHWMYAADLPDLPKEPSDDRGV